MFEVSTDKNTKKNKRGKKHKLDGVEDIFM